MIVGHVSAGFGPFCPTNVRTGMIDNDQTTKLFIPGRPLMYITSVVLPVDAGCVEKLAAG